MDIIKHNIKFNKKIRYWEFIWNTIWCGF
jgi:hypothetical protein